MFTNLHVYRLTSVWDITPDRLLSELEKSEFRPCGPQETKSVGWVSPREGHPLLYTSGKNWLMALRIETKSVPAPEVKRAVKAAAKDFEQKNGYKPGRKQMAELKEDAFDQLLPRAFPKRTTIDVLVCADDGWVAFNTGTPGKADEVVAALFKIEPVVPLSSLRTNESPSDRMSDWLIGEETPEPFTVDRECELKGHSEDKPTVKYTRLSLERDEIKQHVEEGKNPVKLAMTWNDRISFVLTDRLQVKRLEFLKIVMGDINKKGEDADAVFESTLTVLAGELRNFFPDLTEALGGEADYAV